jgi:hypothetical protein
MSLRRSLIFLCLAGCRDFAPTALKTFPPRQPACVQYGNRHFVVRSRPRLFPAPEVRQKVAHGETVVTSSNVNQPRMGRKNGSSAARFFCRPCRGFETFVRLNPRLSPWAIFCRCSAAFNQAGEILPAVPQSARGRAHSKTLRAICTPSEFAPASWTAVALHRFSYAHGRRYKSFFWRQQMNFRKIS